MQIITVIFWILRKLLPISLEPGWVCPLALIRRATNFLQKSFSDPQHVISSLNFDHYRGTPHRLAASESFVRCHVHVGLESGVINSKKIEKCETFAWRHFISPRCGKKFKP
jgi:hypothetical protein